MVIMVYFDLSRLFNPQKRKEEKRIIQKAKEKGVESLTEEEKKIYEELKKQIYLA